jgi:hypothetical protein
MEDHLQWLTVGKGIFYIGKNLIASKAQKGIMLGKVCGNTFSWLFKNRIDKYKKFVKGRQGVA